MPQYIIFKIKGKGKSQQTKTVGFVPHVKNIRRAWGWFKKNHKRKLQKGWDYLIFPINHGRIWSLDGKKWVIGSWYGNHKQAK
jgi:hypothetical protein